MGKGVTGKIHGTFLNPDMNAIIFAVLPSDQADRAVSTLKPFTQHEPSLHMVTNLSLSRCFHFLVKSTFSALD